MTSARRFGALSAVSYLLLTSTYLLYWSHVEYFVDDWILTKAFREAARGGAAGVVDFIARAAQNEVYGKFRLHWLGVLYGFLVTSLGGYSPKINFAALLAVHAGCAWLLSQGLWRLGVERGLSFLAGALYLLAPSTHFALLTNFTNPFFVLGTFWVLLMLWCFARGAAAGAAACAVTGLFSGEQAFLLLWGLLPLAWLCFRRGALRPIAAVWAALAVAGSVYLLAINRAPIVATGLTWRYEWSWGQLLSNIVLARREMRQLSGVLQEAQYRVAPQGVDALLALGATALVAAVVWRLHEEEPRGAAWKWAALFALGGTLLAYGPVLWVGGTYSRYRYYYALSPFAGLALAAVLWIFGRRRLVHALLGGAVAGFFTLNAAADLRQCWIPQSQHHRALDSRLRQLQAVEPGDILIISGTPYEIGTAQHFTMHSSVTADPFAEWATGVAPLQVGFELVDREGVLWLDHREGQMGAPLSSADLRRAHLLAWQGGSFLQLRWAAREVGHEKLQMLPLKGADAPAGIEDAVFSPEQLSLQAGHIYIAKHAH